jgi:sRNA-binding protein
MSQLNTSAVRSATTPPGFIKHRPRNSRIIRRILVERFVIFRAAGTVKYPLKIGIDKDIRTSAPDLTAREVARVLADYTGGPTYLGGVIEGVARYDLEGHPVGFVTAGHARYASGRLSGILAQMNAAEARKRAAAAQ